MQGNVDNPSNQSFRGLVIQLGGVSDLALSLGAIEAIRRHHPNTTWTVLTSPQAAKLARLCDLVEVTWVDPMHPWWHLPGIWQMARRIRAEGFAGVYDLTHSKRSNSYFRLMGRDKLPWSGAVPWCSHPYHNPEGPARLLSERLKEQLQIANIEAVPEPSLGWLKGDMQALRSLIPADQRYVLLAPGGKKDKRWAEAEWLRCMQWLSEHGFLPVLVGDASDHPVLRFLEDMHYKQCLNLGGKTDLGMLAELIRGAKLVVGGDTAPAIFSALLKQPTLIIAGPPSFAHARIPLASHITRIDTVDPSTLLWEELAPSMEDMLLLDSPS